ncbi:MAG: hydrogenase expression/formation protein HypE [Candidatus Sabulitectum sp.]|nr:hydrogenase expression/formation protein HypE [Candidatus Sabulitectum sp.]
MSVVCPSFISRYPVVTMAHGGGGRLMNQLLDEMIHVAFRTTEDSERHDGAVLETAQERIAFTTDSYVITPLFFPGGDIGELSIYGTVNDLAMCGAMPRWISLGFILEEGLPMLDLQRVVDSIARAAERCGVQVVTGDTKVVERGKADGLYINTSGIGVLRNNTPFIGPASIKEGDAVILSGDVGRHGMAVMSVREGLSFSTTVESDLAPLSGPVDSLIGHGLPVHCMRDLTRGGLASSLNEIASAAGLGINLCESKIPVQEEVLGACEVLGFDPLYVANEGRMVLILPREAGEEAVSLMRSFKMCENAALIGSVVPSGIAPVTVKTSVGTSRVLDMISGDQLPRIC